MGRKRRHPIETLRTKVWFQETSRLYGNKSAYWFWKNYGKGVGSLTTWTNYKAGIHSPKFLEGKGAVPVLAEKFPWTAEIYNALFWRVLKKDWPSQQELTQEYSKLGGSFSVLPQIMLHGGFRENKHSDGSVPLDDLFDQLANDADGDFYTLQAVVLLFVQAKDAHSKFWDMCCALYREILPKLILEMDTPFKGEIFDHVDNLAGKIDDRFLNKPGHVFKSWRDEIPRYNLLLSDHLFTGLKSQRRFLALPDDVFSDRSLKELADAVSNDVCDEESLMLYNKELWKPLSWALAKVYHQQLSRNEAHKVLEQEFQNFGMQEAGKSNLDDSFHIAFRG